MIRLPILRPLKFKLHAPILRRDLLRVVPLQVIRLPVMQVHARPVRVVSRVKRPAFDVELVREDEHHLFIVLDGGAGEGGARCIGVDEPPPRGDVGDIDVEPKSGEGVTSAFLTAFRN
jgi:hypothetical protein